MSFIQLNLQEMKILVVDDSSTARKFLSEMLRQIGIGHVAVAADGAEAIERLRTFSADLMLCDLHMLPLDGIELTRLIRNASDSPNPYLPIIMLTADATQAQMKSAMNAGVNAFMSKPAKMNDLHRKLYAMFARPQVFIRDGRTLRPLLAASACDPAAAPQKPVAVKAPTLAASPPAAQPPAAQPKDDDGESADVSHQPLTRRDLGFR